MNEPLQPRAVVTKANTRDRERAEEMMIKVAEAGMPVVVGTSCDLVEGSIFACHSGKALRVLRRATREEFLAACPGTSAGKLPKTPFYYKMDLVRDI